MTASSDFTRVRGWLLGWKLGFQTIRKLQSHIMVEMVSPKTGDCILDAGCGSGYISLELGKAPTIVAFDIFPDPVKVAKESLTQLGYDGLFVVCSATSLPFRSNVFDKVLLSSVLQHTKVPCEVLEDIHRVLNAVGVFVINVPSNRQYLYLPSIFREKYSYMEKKLWDNFKALHKWSMDDMQKMLKDAGFTVSSAEYSPKYVAAFFYEIQLWLMTLEPKRIVKRLLFFSTPLVYLLSKLDCMLPKKMYGSEFIMKSKKSSNVIKGDNV